MPDLIVLPQVKGWQQVGYEPLAPWQPLHSGAEHVLLGRYKDASGHVVDVSFALYAAQGDGREAGGFGQGALPLNSEWSWERSAQPLGQGMADRIQTAGPVYRLAETYYRSGKLLTGSNTRLKLQNIVDRLLLKERATAALIISAEDQVPGRPPADISLRAFLDAAGPVDAWMDRVASGR